uniref:Uncharacterized protein n=1 Tax=Arundo donax TaxID=35708 RepID=A0A0A9G6D0_ARUDO
MCLMYSMSLPCLRAN